MIVLALLRPLPLPEAAKPALRWVVPVKDGQLCWVAIAFCASALYEFATVPSESGRAIAKSLQFANGFATAMLVASSILAAGGALFGTTAERPEGVGWVKHYACLCVSMMLALVSSVLYAIIHFGVHGS
jgi:hypothetical protein